jgi:hypothetical protein
MKSVWVGAFLQYAAKIATDRRLSKTYIGLIGADTRFTYKVER